MTDEKLEGSALPCSNAKSRDWYAWINLMPPPPDEFHVVGEVYVPNPGVDPVLLPKEPQGINPSILLLDLYLLQKPGMWPQVFVWKQARYNKVMLSGQRYKAVQIFCGKDVIAEIPVQEVH